MLGPVAANFSNPAGATSPGANYRPAGTDPRFGPLASNGGPTPTYALLPGSSLINASSNPAGPARPSTGPALSSTAVGTTAAALAKP